MLLPLARYHESALKARSSRISPRPVSPLVIERIGSAVVLSGDVAAGCENMLGATLVVEEEAGGVGGATAARVTTGIGIASPSALRAASMSSPAVAYRCCGFLAMPRAITSSI